VTLGRVDDEDQRKKAERSAILFQRSRIGRIRRGIKARPRAAMMRNISGGSSLSTCNPFAAASVH